MKFTVQHPQIGNRARMPKRSVGLGRPHAALLTAMLVVIPSLAMTAGGCAQGPRMDAPFTLSDPTQRHPIKVGEGQAILELSAPRGARGLTGTQWNRLYNYLAKYNETGTSGIVVRTPSGSGNQAEAKRVYSDVRHAMRRSGISPRDVKVRSYHASHVGSAPVRLSFMELRAQGPDCGDWSENLARNPANLPSPNMGCATQRNLAAMIADPNDLLQPRGEAPRPGERRDTVWGKYVKGEPTGAKWAPNNKQLPERALTSESAAGD